MPITSKLVKDFYAAALSTYKVKVVDKADSKFMKFISDFLSALGVMDKEMFMKEYTTTIGRSIYIPFEIGVEGSSGGYRLRSQIDILVHELVHVDQYNDAPAEFTLKYLLYRSDRASYEAQAYAADLEMAWWWDGKGYDAKKRADLLIHYGLKQKHCDYVANYLAVHDDIFQQGGGVNPVAAWAKEWLTVNGAK